MALSIEVKALIMINRKQSTFFQLKRSKCHGCLFTSFLFLFAADALRYILDDDKHKVEGIILHDSTRHTNSMLADDTSLFLKGDQENLNRTKRVFDTYCQVWGAKIHWNKTAAIWASPRPHNLD